MIKDLLKKISTSLSDETYIKFWYFKRFKRFPDLKNPQTFNEKLQWLKLNYRKPLLTTIVDKYEVKKYIADIIGEEYLIRTLGVWDSFDDIDFDSLPDKFVLKCTHDSGGNVICRDKATLDKDKARAKIEKSLNTNYYYFGREWPYKNLKPRIIAEEYIEDFSGSGTLKDYKFFCFNGKAVCIDNCVDRETGDTKHYFFDINWEFKKYNKKCLTIPENLTLPKPENFDKMIELAETLSKGFPFVRVDLYNSEGKIYFGEYTLFPWSGFYTGFTEEFNLTCNDMINIDIVK